MGLFQLFKGKDAGKSADTKIVLGAPAKGEFVPMAQVPDEVFSHAPVDGTVSQLTDTLHAVGLEAAGMELLIHVGVDTVEMAGDGFSNAVQVGQQVKKGDLLLTMDLEKIRAAGHADTVIMAVTNSDSFNAVEPAASGAVEAGDPVLQVSK